MSRDPAPPTAFLADFGLAKTAATGSKLTRTGVALGTPAYMSPEQARGEVSSLTPATDVWSLGCVLHEMLAGRPPWPGATPGALVAAILTRPPERLRRARPDAPREVEGVLAVALARPAGIRYPDAGALRDDLDRLLRGERPQARLPRARRAGFALLALLAALAAVALLARDRTPRTLPAPAPAPGPSRAERLLAQARALASSDPREASRLVAEALRERPGDRALERELARRHFRSGDWAEADAVFGRLLETDPGDAEARLARGVTRFLARQVGGGDLGPPVPDLLEAARQAPGPGGALARAILVHAEERWEDFEREIATAPPSWEARVVEAMLRHHGGARGPEEQHKAVQLLAAAIEEGPSLPFLAMERGHARSLLGDLAGARADYDEALRADPAYFAALVNRGSVRRMLGDGAGALDDLTAAIRLRPRSPEALNGRGVVQAQL
ncbi:MAG: protein kinase, partial [Planctomycetales bacterium]|nr:protein kinase [Planctomycetales bacterium]